MNESTVDVIVVGGGIAGVGCAAMLPEHISLALLEAEPHCGYHATGRSAAAWIAGYGGPEIRALTRDSHAYLAEPPASLGERSFLATRGEMLLSRNESEDQELLALIAMTPDLVEISVDEACGRVPVLRREGLRRVAFTADAFDIDADRLMQAWLRALRRRGVPISTGQPVSDMQWVDGYWVITRADGKVWRARTVVNAAGAWADSLAALAGLGPLGLVPHRRSAALIAAPRGHEVCAWPLIVAADESWYARPMGGKLMVSPADETPVLPHDAFAEELTIAEGLDGFEQAVNFDVERVETTWAGLRTFAPDRVPVVGWDPRIEGFFWLAGQGGYGIQTAPALSRLAAGVLGGTRLGASQCVLQRDLSPHRLVFST